MLPNDKALLAVANKKW